MLLILCILGSYESLRSLCYRELTLRFKYQKGNIREEQTGIGAENSESRKSVKVVKYQRTQDCSLFPYSFHLVISGFPWTQ